MTDCPFYYPIPVRWMDLGTQGHVNNVFFLSYFESGRLAYLREVGIWDGRPILDLGLVVADMQISFQAPIFLDQNIRVGVRVLHIGNKSIHFDSRIEDEGSGQVLSTSVTVMVAYDYRSQKSVQVPDDWRKAIEEFEQKTFD